MDDSLKIQEELVLYPYDQSIKHRLKIECVPESLELKMDWEGKPMEYGGVVPGRQVFPEDRDVSLKIYDEHEKVVSRPLARVRVTFQNLARTGTGKITNVEYKISSVNTIICQT